MSRVVFALALLLTALPALAAEENPQCHKGQSLRGKESRIHCIPGKPARAKGRSQCDGPEALAGGRSEVGEVTGEHFRGRDVGPVDRRR